jgi:glycosyltransferase involved in cell wall biosynthesis
VLVVGRAEPGKALDLAISGFQRARNLPCRLTVIGDGSQLRRLREQAMRDERIRLLGAVPSDRILQAFSESDIFVFPSRYDIFGNVLVEAMGAGLATIASSRPGAVADLCVPGVNSIVVSSDDPRDWACALTRLVDDDALRFSLGAAAARAVHDRWTIEHAADAMLAGFRLAALVGKRGRRH